MSGRFFKGIKASKLGGELLASVLRRSKEGKEFNSLEFPGIQAVLGSYVPSSDGMNSEN